MNSLDHLVPLGLAVAGGLGTSCFFGLFEPQLRSVLGTFFAVFLRPVLLINDSLETFWRGVRGFYREQFTENGRLNVQGVFFQFIGSILYLLFFLTFAFSDFHLLTLSLEAVGISRGQSTQLMGAAELTAFSVIAAILFWGAVLCDLMGVTSTAPWRESLTPQWRTCLLYITVFCLVLAVVVTGSMGLLRGKVTADEARGGVSSYQPVGGGVTDLNQSPPTGNMAEVQAPNKESELYYWITLVASVCIPVLVLIGGVFSSWGLVMVVKFAMLIGGFILMSPLGLFFFGSTILMNILDRIYLFLNAVLQLFAVVGRRVLRLFGWKPGPPEDQTGQESQGPAADQTSGDDRDNGCGNKSDSQKGPSEETQDTVKPASNGWNPFGN